MEPLKQTFLEMPLFLVTTILAALLRALLAEEQIPYPTQEIKIKVTVAVELKIYHVIVEFIKNKREGPNNMGLPVRYSFVQYVWLKSKRIVFISEAPKECSASKLEDGCKKGLFSLASHDKQMPDI
ncbi:hypothetical protein ACROYT_G015689 [Oculina patagonica]